MVPFYVVAQVEEDWFAHFEKGFSNVLRVFERCAAAVFGCKLVLLYG